MIAGEPDIAAAAAALRVLDDHFAALNAGDAEALAATLHFPHYRLTAAGMQAWETPATYLDDFYARAGAGWARSAFIFRNVVAAGPAKVHLDVAFARFDAADQEIGRFRSLWIVTNAGGRWAAAARSSFAG
jgi:hypothetical protein